MTLSEVQHPLQLFRIRQLYRRAFPKCERKPFWMILQMRLRRRADIWVIHGAHGFAGFAITLNAGDMVLLDYFAVEEKERGNGLGGAALRMLQQKYQHKRFFLEIESVYEAAVNLADRCRRKKFYLANGMTEMQVMANVFGTPMELLGYECKITFEEYQSVYRNSFGEWAVKNVQALPYPVSQREK